MAHQSRFNGMPSRTNHWAIVLLLSASCAAGCARPAPRQAPPPGPAPYGAPQGPPPPAQGYAPGPQAAQPGPPPAGAVLPAPVRATLEQYVHILRTSRDLQECAARFTPIAGGGLVNEDGRTLRQTVPPYSLKKDHQNVRFYADPIQITRMDVHPGATDGYGPSALRGTGFKVWIAKAPGQPGMPAPIYLMVPEGHPFVTGPRVVGIGSL